MGALQGRERFIHRFLLELAPFSGGEKASVSTSMSHKRQTLRSLVKERLEAAAEDILGLFEKTVAAYEEEISLLKDFQRQHKLISAAFSPEVRLNRADVEQPFVSPGWSPSLNQDLKLMNVKGEQVELWTSQEATWDPFTAVPVKSEEEEKLCSSHAQQSPTEEKRSSEADRGSDPAGNQDPVSPLQPDPEEQADPPESENNNDLWQEKIKPETKTKRGKKTETKREKSRVNRGVRGETFTEQGQLTKHMKGRAGEKAFGCKVHEKRFALSGNVNTHTTRHTGEKPLHHKVCGKGFTAQTRERPLSCDVCDKRFREEGRMKAHMRIHTGEKPFGCDVCKKTYRKEKNLKKHIKRHTEEKPFDCEVCGKRRKSEKGC